MHPARPPPACCSLGHGWRLVVLDTTEMSGHSDYPPESRQYKEAQVGSGVQLWGGAVKRLHCRARRSASPGCTPCKHASVNLTFRPTRPPQAYMAAHPLSAENPQMSDWNGGVTAQQLAWLRGELAAAEAAGERVIVAAHHQVGQGAARDTHMAWNWRDIQAALLASPAFRLALAGHDHCGGYSEIDGRHFLTVEALLESPPGGNAYAAVQVCSSCVHIVGSGDVTSRTLAV